MSKFKYVLLGNSAAAIAAAEAIRANDKKGTIAIVSAEDSYAYSPALTTYYISGNIAAERVFYRKKDFYDSLKIKTFLGKPAVSLNKKNKTVELDNNEKISYEKLLIATGGAPKKPDIKGAGLKGVFTLRTMDDAEKIKERAAEAKNAVVLGGGLVGLRAAYALHQRGLKITVVVGSKNILSQNMDEKAAAIMQNWLKEKHFNILTETNVAAIEGKTEVKSVKLGDGSKIEAEMVIIGKGVAPNASFAKEAGLEVDRGIVVNDEQLTNDANIYAAGDVAQGYDKLLKKKVVNAIWPVAVDQGRVAGSNMAGAKAKYNGSFAMNSVDFFGLTAQSMGITRPNNPKDYEIIVKSEPAKNIYRKLVLKDDVLVGAVLIGDVDRAGILTSLIDDGTKVSDFKEDLKGDEISYMFFPKNIRDKKIGVS